MDRRDKLNTFIAIRKTVNPALIKKATKTCLEVDSGKNGTAKYKHFSGICEYDESVKGSRLARDSVLFHASQLVEGYNTAIVVNGSNGAGKTSLVFGKNGDFESSLTGIAAERIWGEFATLKAFTGQLEVSMMEVSSSKIADLISGGLLNINSTKEGAELPVVGQTWWRCQSYEDMKKKISEGLGRRDVGLTFNKSYTSNKNSVFLTFRMILLSNNVTVVNRKYGSLTFVDCAGFDFPEKALSSGNKTNICVLSRCIECLGSDSGAVPPYRESKFTQVLKPLVNGRSISTLITVVPHDGSSLGVKTLLDTAVMFGKIECFAKPVVRADVGRLLGESNIPLDNTSDLEQRSYVSFMVPFENWNRPNAIVYEKIESFSKESAEEARKLDGGTEESTLHHSETMIIEEEVLKLKDTLRVIEKNEELLECEDSGLAASIVDIEKKKKDGHLIYVEMSEGNNRELMTLNINGEDSQNAFIAAVERSLATQKIANMEASIVDGNSNMIESTINTDWENSAQEIKVGDEMLNGTVTTVLRNFGHEIYDNDLHRGKTLAEMSKIESENICDEKVEEIKNDLISKITESFVAVSKGHRDLQEKVERDSAESEKAISTHDRDIKEIVEIAEELKMLVEERGNHLKELAIIRDVGGIKHSLASIDEQVGRFSEYVPVFKEMEEYVLPQHVPFKESRQPDGNVALEFTSKRDQFGTIMEAKALVGYDYSNKATTTAPDSSLISGNNNKENET
uniref:Kinesin motor domain-containing protein n=1 Tax=Rhabditophanes sp. KR3021 TaxID=114890 RepID=A0AC35TRK3_9BILA